MDEPNAWDEFRGFLDGAGDWVRAHRAEIEAVLTWGAVGHAGREARLYVPFDLEAWRTIAGLSDRGDRDETFDHEQQIVDLYGPGGTAFDALRQELLSAPLLSDRRREVQEVLDSLHDERYFVTVCGALPLVEFSLSSYAGKWDDPRKHLDALRAHLDTQQIGTEDEVALLLNMTALEMLLNEVPEIWKSGRQTIGAITEKLNRHTALHGSTRGWDDRANATRAVLLLAATAKVVQAMQSNDTG